MADRPGDIRDGRPRPGPPAAPADIAVFGAVAGWDPGHAEEYPGVLRRFADDHAPGLAGLICALAMVVAGCLQGLLWAAAAPRFDVAAGLTGAESAFAVQSSVDAYFGLICLVGGIVGGVVAFWRAADAGWPVPAGLTLGGIGGSLLAGWDGRLLRSGNLLDALPDDASALVIELVDFKVRTGALYLVMPGAAVFVLALLLWATTGPAGGRRRVRERADPTDPTS